jgi:hypothetical protein
MTDRREQGIQIAKKLYPMYCEHFRGAFCEACAPGVIEKAIEAAVAEAVKAERERCLRILVHAECTCPNGIESHDRHCPQLHGLKFANAVRRAEALVSEESQ